MILLLLKVTVLFAAVLALLPVLGKATAGLRHLLCALALAVALLLPLTTLWAPHAIAVTLPVVFAVTASTKTGPAGISSGFLWAPGTILFLLRLAIGYWRLSRVARQPDAGAGVALADVSVPLVYGLLRPVILLPREAETWPDNQRAAAIRHERAHVQRHDLWTSLMAQVVCAVYWFHPLVWLVSRQLRHEQELACDDAVLSAGFEPADYAEALVAASQNLTATFLIGCHMLTNKSLKSRIARLLDSSLPRTTSTASRRVAGLAAAVLLASLGMTWAQPPQAAPQDEKVYKMSEGITAPKLTQKVDPKYTEEARDAKVEGTVTLSVVVGADGLAHQINVVKPLDGGLDQKAVEAVQQWKFTPGAKDGVAVNVRAMIEVNFKLM